ncbi:MAG: ribosome biogenesis GTPase YqeH [Fusobacteriaceae bacterium]
MKKDCVGCGIELQGEFPNKEGYLQPEVLKESRKEHYCQRCFKIKNYGKNIPVELSREDYRKEVAIASDSADVALAVFDIIDFEGSFDVEILDILREMESIIVINKLDLIPEEKHPSEVAHWVKNRLAEEGIAPLDIAIVSSKNGYGINGIYKKINHFYPNGAKVVVMGVTNVGKSSIVNRLLGTKTLTVSKYPGTTLKINKQIIPKTNITLIDTPGLIPHDRISDLVCGECNLKIIPSSEISRKTYKLEAGRVIFMGGLLNFKVTEIEESKPIISVFASKNVNFLETNAEKQKEYLESYRTDVFEIPCEKCAEEYNKQKFKKETLTIDTGEELAIKGLGWITVKRGPLHIELILPNSIEPIVRKAFIKPKR